MNSIATTSCNTRKTGPIQKASLYVVLLLCHDFCCANIYADDLFLKKSLAMSTFPDTQTGFGGVVVKVKELPDIKHWTCSHCRLSVCMLEDSQDRSTEFTMYIMVCTNSKDSFHQKAVSLKYSE